MVEHDVDGREAGGQLTDLRRVIGNEVHLDGEAERLGFAPRGLHGRVAHVAVLDGAAGRGRLARRAHLMDPERDDPLGVLFYQRLHAGGRIRRDGVEQAGALEEAGPGLVGEAVFEVAVIVLVRLGMHDHDVVDS